MRLDEALAVPAGLQARPHRRRLVRQEALAQVGLSSTGAQRIGATENGVDGWLLVATLTDLVSANAIVWFVITLG